MNGSALGNTRAMVFASMGIVINIVLGTIVQTFQIPLLF